MKSLAHFHLQNGHGEVPGGPVVTTLPFHCLCVWVQSLVRELRFHKLHGMVKIKQVYKEGLNDTKWAKLLAQHLSLSKWEWSSLAISAELPCLMWVKYPSKQGATLTKH